MAAELSLTRGPSLEALVLDALISKEDLERLKQEPSIQTHLSEVQQAHLINRMVRRLHDHPHIIFKFGMLFDFSREVSSQEILEKLLPVWYKTLKKDHKVAVAVYQSLVASGFLSEIHTLTESIPFEISERNEALAIAAKFGQVKVFEDLLKDRSLITNEGIRKAYIVALYAKQTAITQGLRGDPIIQDLEDLPTDMLIEEVITAAAREGDLEIVQALVLFPEVRHKQMNEIFKIATRLGHIDMALFLLGFSEITDTTKKEAYIVATYTGQNPLVEALKHHESSIQFKQLPPADDIDIAFFQAVYDGDREIVEALMNLPDLEEEDFFKAYIVAIYAKQEKLAKMLRECSPSLLDFLENPIDPSISVPQALLDAVNRGDQFTIEALMFFPILTREPIEAAYDKALLKGDQEVINLLESYPQVIALLEERAQKAVTNKKIAIITALCGMFVALWFMWSGLILDKTS